MNRSSIVRTTLWITLLAFALPAVLGQPQAPQLPSDEWHLLFLSDQPAGYTHVRTERHNGGYRVETVQKLVLRRGQATVSIESHSVLDETADGAVAAFELEQKQSELPLLAVGKRQGDTLVITERTSGSAPQTSRFQLKPGVMGYMKALRTARQALKKPGDEVSVRIFVPEFKRDLKQDYVFGPKEEIDVRGRRKALRRIEVTSMGLTATQWMDDAFSLQKSVTPMMGLSLVSYRSTQDEVLAQDFSSPPEIFISTSIPVTRLIPDTAKRARYRLTVKQESVKEWQAYGLFQTVGQTTKTISTTELDLEVLKVQVDSDVERPLTDRNFAEYLKSNSYLQSDDEELRRIAARVVGSERNAWKSAQKAARWVHRSVREKHLRTVFATAKEVLQRREGDCTEHAVLLAAICRAAGIPSRVIAGLVFHNGAFVGHMWTEVYVGTWAPIDATRRDPLAGVGHIGLVSSSLESASMSDLFLSIAQVLGNLTIEVQTLE